MSGKTLHQKMIQRFFEPIPYTKEEADEKIQKLSKLTQRLDKNELNRDNEAWLDPEEDPQTFSIL